VTSTSWIPCACSLRLSMLAPSLHPEITQEVASAPRRGVTATLTCSQPTVGQRRSRTIRNSASEGEWARGLVSPVRRNPHLPYSAIAGSLLDVTHRHRPVARRSRAHPTTASTRAPPTPCLRASGATNIATSTGRGSFGSSGSRSSHVAIPIHCPSRSATKFTRSAPVALPSARSRQICSGNFSSRASVEPNAMGISARARSRSARSFSPSSARIRRTCMVTWVQLRV
jgi:hypothetical protein